METLERFGFFSNALDRFRTNELFIVFNLDDSVSQHDYLPPFTGLLGLFPVM
jgi:hypothetical protein